MMSKRGGGLFGKRFFVWLRRILPAMLFSFPGFAFSGQPILVGAIFAESGEAAPNHVELYHGMVLAVNRINERGGVLGSPVDLRVFDNASTALGSRKAAEQAVQSGVIAVIGAIRSSNSLAAAPVLQKAGIPMITPASTHPDVTGVGDYIFRVCYLDSFQGRVMAEFARQDLKAENAVVLTNAGNKYSMGLSDSFISNFIKMNGNILWEGDYLKDVTDFKAVAATTKNLSPDVVFVPDYTQDAAAMLKALREAGVTAVFLGGDGWNDAMFQYGGSMAEGAYYTTHWHKSLPGQDNQTFFDDYVSRYGEPKDRIVSLAYDAVNLLADAIKRAGSLDRKNIRDALAATNGFKGVTGVISFDKNRDPIKSAIILRFENNLSVYVKTVMP